MTPLDRHTASGYWYGDENRADRSSAVLNAMRDYRVVENAMRARTRESMRMNENDLLALRALLKAEKEGRSMSPRDLARELDITTASTTMLVKRLEKSGHIERQPHPTDKRSIVLLPTHSSDHEVRSTLNPMHARMREVAQSLTAEDALVVVRFLDQMSAAVEVQDDPHHESAAG